MKFRRVLVSFVSIVLAVSLVVLLIKFGRINLRLLLHQLKCVSLLAFFELVTLNGLLVYLSTEKWRSVDNVLRHATDSVPSRISAYAASSTGMVLGLFLPVQLGMAAARTLETVVHGQSLKRGTAGSLIEQSFDVLVVGLVAVASSITYFLDGGELTWTVSATTTIALGLFIAGPAVRLVQKLTAFFSANVQMPRNRFLRIFLELQHMDGHHSNLARRLMLLSTARFGVLIIMAGQTAAMIDLKIPFWHFGAAMPFVVIATAVGLTPGGLGVNEFIFTSGLTAFGTRLEVAARWSVANRMLVTGACLALWACTALVQLLVKSADSHANCSTNKAAEAIIEN